MKRAAHLLGAIFVLGMAACSGETVEDGASTDNAITANPDGSGDIVEQYACSSDIRSVSDSVAWVGFSVVRTQRKGRPTELLLDVRYILDVPEANMQYAHFSGRAEYVNGDAVKVRSPVNDFAFDARAQELSFTLDAASIPADAPAVVKAGGGKKVLAKGMRCDFNLI